MHKLPNFRIALITILIIFYNSSCTDLLTSISSNNILGGWNVKTIKDDKTNQISEININNINRILGNKIGDALFFNDDGTFEIFRQIIGNSGTKAGRYEIDVTTLSLTFNNEKPLKRSISSVSETELIMRDTILGVAKTITYHR